MNKLLFAAAIAASVAPFNVYAQDTGSANVSDAGTPTNSRIQLYGGVLGGYEHFDRERNAAGIPGGVKGGLVEGVVGLNFDLGPIMVGAEGNATKGFSGDIDWEYGAAGRVGLRAGKDSMFFGKVGYQWVNLKSLGPNSPDFDGMTYGAGVELSPVDFGMSQGDSSNIRLRMQIDTQGNFHSIRPMAGAILKF